MGRVDTNAGEWVTKVAESAPEICISRYALLQLSPNCGTSFNKEAITSLESSPWKSGSLYCMPVDQISEVKAQPARPRAASADRAKPSKPNTLQLKNIPFEYTRTGLCEELAAHGFGYAIDFLYLPINASGKNVGHAFVNLRTKDTAREFIETLQGVPARDCLPAFSSGKVCQVCLAEVQGRDANMYKLATAPNIARWLKHEDWQPLFLDDYGARIPISEWTNNDGSGMQRRCTSAKNTPLLAPQRSPVLKPRSDWGLQASAPEFVPQFETVLNFLASSPELNPDAKEFVPFSFSAMEMEMLPDAADQEGLAP